MSSDMMYISSVSFFSAPAASMHRHQLSLSTGRKTFRLQKKKLFLANKKDKQTAYLRCA
jgi:hypothetical protein